MPRLCTLHALVILGACLETTRADEKPLPAAPHGYNWERAPAAKAALLRPDTWHFRTVEKTYPLQYFVTKQGIRPEAKPGSVQFETGLSMMVFRYAPLLMGVEVKPSEYARKYLELMRSRPEFKVELTGNCKVGPLEGSFVQSREENNADPLRMRQLVIPNDATGALYLIMYESPVRIWEKDWPAAETILKQIVIDPKLGGRNAVDYDERGVTKARQGDVDGAIADFNKAIELDAAYAPAYRNRGIARGEKRMDSDGAVADLTKAIELDPRISLSFYSRGQLRKQKGDLNGSLADLNKAIALDPKFPFAYSLRGAVRASQQDLAGAVADFDKSLELLPRNEDALCLRAGAKYQLTDLAGAIADCDGAIAVNPNKFRAFLVRAMARLELGDDDESKKDFDRCLELAPDASAVPSNRGSRRLRGARNDPVPRR